jgi:4-diphosphocytidyl-2-C-methyl-D-erythritol kinase
MKTFSFKAYAKLNLYLEVIDRRPDEYHNIESVISLISLNDNLYAEEVNEGFRVFTNHFDVPEDKDNLVFKLLLKLKDKGLINKGLHVFIEKHIPSGAGLGGGSSDATFTLLELNKRLELGLSRKDMADIVIQIGSDCPLFLTQTGTALMEGRGEIITDIDFRDPSFILVLFPFGQPSSTGELYAKVNKGLTKRVLNISDAFTSIKEGKPFSTDLCFNRFEGILSTELPVVREMLELLRKGGAGTAQLTGSGTAVFGLFPSLSQAVGMEKQARQRGWWVRLAQFHRQ